MKHFVGKIIFAGFIASVAAISGCATGSKPDAMVAQIVAPVHKSEGDVSVAVSGGKETSKMGASQISDDAFAQALRDSIGKAGLFAKVSTEGARYPLDWLHRQSRSADVWILNDRENGSELHAQGYPIR